MISSVRFDQQMARAAGRDLVVVVDQNDVDAALGVLVEADA